MPASVYSGEPELFSPTKEKGQSQTGLPFGNREDFWLNPQSHYVAGRMSLSDVQGQDRCVAATVDIAAASQHRHGIVDLTRGAGIGL